MKFALNITKISKTVPNSAWCLIFLGLKENHGIYRFELANKLPKNMCLGTQIIELNPDLSINCEGFNNFEYQL